MGGMTLIRYGRGYDPSFVLGLAVMAYGLYDVSISALRGLCTRRMDGWIHALSWEPVLMVLNERMKGFHTEPRPL